MKVAVGKEHATCYNVRKRRRGWTELVVKQRFAKFKVNRSRKTQNANVAEEMDVSKAQEEEKEIGKGDFGATSDDEGKVDLEFVCTQILLSIVSAVLEGEFCHWIFFFCHLTLSTS